MTDLLPVDEARDRILADIVPLAGESVALEDALGRVLERDLMARRTQPPFAASAMDGYAVRSEDLAKLPADLKQIGVSAAGHGYSGVIGAGETVRIFTGAPVPEGADAVLIQENAKREVGDRVVVNTSVSPGQYIRKRGLDFAINDAPLKANTVIDARAIALAAAMGHARIPVRRRPRVAILATGDELVLPHQTVGGDQIIASNGYGAAAQLRQWGAEPFDLGIAPDDPDIIKARLQAAHLAGVDAIITIGGASVGEHDLIKAALSDVGMELDFWQIAMRPGKPLIFGRLGEIRVLGLPGNPVSSIVCGILFIQPLIKAMLGLPTALQIDDATLGAAVGENDRRQDYLRAELHTGKAGNLVATPFARQDSSMLVPLAAANCLVIRPPLAPAEDEGAPCRILRLSPSL